jgi:hypothetical protein
MRSNFMQRYGLRTRLAAAAATVVLIAGCEDRGRPIDAPQPAPLAELEAATELPYAQPSQVSYYEPERGYQWAERAYGLQRTFYDAPPDYGFYYDEVEPYVWETADDWTLYAEPWGGDYRYYYYEPGADFPYFVRDREYGYAYGATGLLIAVFDAGGRYLPVDVVYRVAPTAGRYYARGHDLRRASREARRVVIDDRTWATEGPRVSRSASPWLRAARDDKAWRKWRERDGDRELVRFQAETRRRQDAGEAWRERVARQQTAEIQGRDRRLEAEALRAQRGQIREDRRDDRQALQAQRARVDVERRQARSEQQERQQQRAQAQERERNVAAQRQAQAERQQVRIAERQAQAEARRNQQARAERQQVQQAQQAERRQAVAEQRQQAQRHAEQRQAMAQQQRQQAQAERQQARQQQARAPSAADRGQPAATRERPAKAQGGKERPADRGHGKKD